MIRITGFLAGVALALLSAAPLARGQGPTLAVSPVDISNRQATLNIDFTEMLIISLSRAGTFNILDERIDSDTDPDYHLGSRLTSSVDESYDGDSDEYRTEVHVRVDIAMRDASGNLTLTDFGEGRDVREEGRDVRDLARLLRSADTNAEAIVEIAGSAFQHLTNRLTMYFNVIGWPTRGGAVEGSVVTLMDSTTAVINRGRTDGLLAGDELEIRRGEVVTDADGTVIFSRMETIGTAEVSEVQDAGALITTAGLELEEGDTVVAAAEDSAPAYVETGDALLDAGFYDAAALEYLAALAADPELLDVLLPLSLAQMEAGASSAASESFADLLDAGFPLELTAIHNHSFGRCEGTFTLTRESVSYRSPREDDPDHRFDVPLYGVVESGLRFDEVLEIRAPSEEHVEKNEGDSRNWTFSFDVRGSNAAVSSLISRYISAGR